MKNAGSNGLKPEINFGNIPLYFIANKGQTDANAAFYAKTMHYTLWLTKSGLIFDYSRINKAHGTKSEKINEYPKETTIEHDVSRLNFLGASPNPEVVSLGEASLKVNYFRDKDPSKWRENVPTSAAVLYKELYPHVDLKVYGIEKEIEYDWVVKPGGNVESIRLDYAHVKGTRLDENGNLLIETATGKLKHKAPYSYQVIDGKQVEVKSSFKPLGNNTYGFNVAEYDEERELIIDPVILAFSSFLGDKSDIRGIQVDADGFIYVIGNTTSDQFPIQNGVWTSMQDWRSGYLTKLSLSENGNASIVYSTFLRCKMNDLEIGDAGCVYLTGSGTTNVYTIDTTKSGYAGLLYSDGTGLTQFDSSSSITVDSHGYIYVVGTSSSGRVTQNAFQSTHSGMGDVFLAKLDPSAFPGETMMYFTFLGGPDIDEGWSVAVDDNGRAYITGITTSTNFPARNGYREQTAGSGEAFVSIIDTTLSGDASLVYSSFLGGYLSDRGRAIAVDKDGYVYVTGETDSPDFPTRNPFQSEVREQDVFLAKLDPSKSGDEGLVYSTILGGDGNDYGCGLLVDDYGCAYISGGTESTNFPVQEHYQSDPGDSDCDAFFAKISTRRSGNTSLIFSTYLGGGGYDSADDITIDGNRNIYVAGKTESADFPILDAYHTTFSQNSGFISKFNRFPTSAQTPELAASSVLSVTSETAILEGTITDTGGADVFEYGVCWSTTENFTPNEGTRVVLAGHLMAEKFSVPLDVTGIPADTTVYFYTFASNPEGTAYSAKSQFINSPLAIIITSPNGGETLLSNTGHTITWTSQGEVGDVTVAYSTDNGSSWMTISPSAPNSGLYDWVLPSTTSHDCLIRVAPVNGTIADTSDTTFSVTVSSNLPPPEERQVLIDLYNSTNGDSWTNRENWKKQDGSFNDIGSEHTWFGVTVTNNRVTELRLNNNQMGGTLPDSIYSLPQLKVLDLGNNSIEGFLDIRVSALRELEILDLSWNNIGGNIPTSIGDLPKLEALNLQDTRLSGPIPAQLYNLGTLKTLNLSYVQLNSPLPPGIGNLDQLESLYLTMCNLSGSLPVEFGNLRNLRILELNINSLTELGTPLGNLTNLTYLNASNNQIEGGFPLQLLMLPNITYLNLANNKIGGTLPPELGNLSKLEECYLQSTDLTGPIPPEFGNLLNLKELRLYSNNLDGSIPAELGNCVNFIYLDLSRNDFSGTIPPELGNLTNLTKLVLSSNSLEGGIPATFGNLINVDYLSLSCNRLKGDIPVEIQYMQSLSSLSIGYNALYASDPGLNAFLTQLYHAWQGTQTIVPAAVTATGLSDSIRLDWTPIDLSFSSGSYNVYYSETPGGPYTLHSTVDGRSSSSVTITDVPYGYFVVTSLTSPHSANSNIVESDYSEEVYALRTGVSLSVVSPNGGEVLQSGATQPITWTASGIAGTVDIAYSTAGIDGTYLPIATVAADAGTYSWQVPDVDSAACYIRISAADGILTDTGDTAFTIQPEPSISITSPTAGMSWKTGGTAQVNWITTNITGDVTVELYKATTLTAALGTVSADAGSITWQVPADFTEGSDYRVRVSRDAVEDYSGYFSISAGRYYYFHGSDFNGDNKADIAFYRPSNSRWYIMGQPSIAWGTVGDIPVPGDYNGDGTTDIAIFRPSTGRWCIMGQPSIGWGAAGDIPIPGDYDGNGTTDIAIFRASNGRWCIMGQPSQGYGISTDLPIPADYDGNGTTDIAVYRPSTGRWCVMGHPSVAWGTPTDIPIPGDFDGDGAADITIFRPSTGAWATKGMPSVRYGASTDVPLINHKGQ
ncbi:MAG: hypothetical protein GY765_25340 [bacterium]|nr:hypothetical protein [bacterium]